MTLSRIVEKLPNNKNLIYVKAIYGTERSSEGVASDRTSPKQEIHGQSEFQIYSAADIESSQGVEQQKTSLLEYSHSFTEGLKSKNVTKFEVCMGGPKQ